MLLDCFLEKNLRNRAYMLAGERAARARAHAHARMWGGHIRQTLNNMPKDGRSPLFRHVELETFNKCNGACQFCPVNRDHDPREHKKMDDQLYEDIIRQLSSIKYAGRFSLYSNNEPLLDTRIYEYLRFAKDWLPHAHHVLCTNGTLLTSVVNFKDIMDCVDVLYIDNYNDKPELAPHLQELYDYHYVGGNYARYYHRAFFVLRRKDERLTTRGGQAPNRAPLGKPLSCGCVNPWEQLVIRPDGRTSLCCNDPLGVYSLSNLNVEPLVEAWNNFEHRRVRKKMLETGRANLRLCKGCDTIF